ncbi:MAG TPA: fibronectin type III domain-containing protein [Jatrophihabitans sp.]|nr:fibronectin type III domain-containing protein [Jatrophihabitans sp.]
MRRIGRSAGRTGLAGLAATGLVVGLLTLPHAATAVTGSPTPPGPVSVSGVTMNSANLSWTPATDTVSIEGYQVYRQAGGGASTLIATTDGGVNHYTATHLYASTNYTFSIKAIDITAQVSPSPSTASFSTLANPNTTPPSPPADASVAAHAFSSSRVDVVWAGSPTADVSGYLVFHNTDTSTPIARIDLPGGLRYSDNGLSAGGLYGYVIKAIDSAGNISAPTSTKPPAFATTPAAGTVLLARGPYISKVTATSAVISWWTNIASAGTVHYGIGSVGSTATDGTAQQHSVTLSGLTGGSTYTYNVGTGSAVLATATFRTAAPAGSTFSFAAIGDFGGASPGEGQNAANIATAGTSFLQTVGDNIYPSAGNPDPNFSTTYSDFDARFFKQFTPVIKSQAFFPANGNQEYYDNGAFWTTFPMPGSNHSWYSYNWGNAHILVLDTEQPFDTSSPQYAFAQSDLSANQSAKWRIVVTQRPPYSSVSTNSSSKAADAILVPLFQNEKVSLVLSGNSHNYERTFPLKNGSPATGGVTYIVTGGGGNGHNAFTIAQPAWSAYRNATSYEYAKVTVSPTSLRVDAIDSVTKKAIDSVTIGASAVTTAYIASSRQGSAVYINGLVKQQVGSTITRSANRTVYLQRFLGGHWTNVLSRTTDANGQMAVGFIQNTVYTYRLYVLASATATAAISGTTTR